MTVKIFSQGELQTNSIVLSKDGKCIIVDVPYVSLDVEEYICRNHLNVVAVLLTHGHFDHVGGVTHLVKRCCSGDVPIYCNERDWALCKSASNNQFGVFSDNCYPTKNIIKGHYILDDFQFDVIETRGHTAGSVVYIFDNIMCSGDTLFCGSIGRTDFPESDVFAMRSSLEKLAKLTANYTVVPGHGSLTDLETEKKFNNYLK